MMQPLKSIKIKIHLDGQAEIHVIESARTVINAGAFFVIMSSIAYEHTSS